MPSQPSSWHGKSLLPIVENKTSELNRDHVLIEHLWEFDEIPPSEGVRTKDWKYFRYVNDKTSEELYDLNADPAEINNLAKDSEYISTLNTLRGQCEELIEKHEDDHSTPPTDLCVETIRDPASLFLRDAEPEFSWVVPNQAVSQLGYQILVSSSKDKIDGNIGDLWDSGNIRSNQSAEISYQGHPLIVGKTYFCNWYQYAEAACFVRSTKAYCKKRFRIFCSL